VVFENYAALSITINILGKQTHNMATGRANLRINVFIWLTVWTSGRLRYSTFSFHKNDKISWLDERFLSSQGLC